LPQRPDRVAWRRLCGVAALALAAGVPRPLSAQGQALVLSVHGGRHTPLVNLTDTGDDMVSGFSFGGGVALQLNRSVALRGMLTYHRTRYRGTPVALADSGAAQYVAAADVQVGWPGTSAFVPYIYVGGGAVATDWDDPAEDGSTRLAGRFGVGLNRVGGLGAWFLEVGGLIYEFNDIGLKRIQFELEARLGFALALGL
jgi:hypothetical protein